MLLDTFIRSDLAASEIDASSWLSVIDMTSREGMDELSDYARAMFYDKFEWDELRTDNIAKKSSKKDQQEAS